MVKITIIPSDRLVGVDGVFRTVNMEGIDSMIHAVQWDDAAGEGEIEYKQRGKSPERITDRARFAQFISRWQAAEPPQLPVPPPGPPKDIADQIMELPSARKAILKANLGIV